MARFVKQQKEFFYQACFKHGKIRQTPSVLVKDTKWVDFTTTQAMAVGENYNHLNGETYYIEACDCPECRRN